MINISRLYCGLEQPADALRYGRGSGAAPSAAERKPVVVWNWTRRCNLRCIHCYSDSDSRFYPGELSTEECRSVIDDLAQYNVPGLLLSGGEPLVRPDAMELARHARRQGLRLTLSTNGTLIDRSTAEELKNIGFAYVGISLDGIGATHDYFRGRSGTFKKTVEAFHNCKAVGQKAGLRLTLSPHNIADLDKILDFIESEEIDRVCFYHLVFSGRGARLENIDAARTRKAVDKIIDRTAQWAREGHPREVLTVDQPADGVHLYLRLQHENPAQAERALELLRWNGGGAHSSGRGIGNIDSQGNVHPDQFWQTITFGNVRDQPFSQIWSQGDHPMLHKLRNRLSYLKGECGRCRHKETCGGGFRVRALQIHGDAMAHDPGCYLTAEERE